LPYWVTIHQGLNPRTHLLAGFPGLGRRREIQRMSTTEAGFLSLLVMAVVAIVALFRFDKRFRLRIKWLGNLFALDGSK
jgi:drug/metabolite transporter (DMT)-like permease